MYNTINSKCFILTNIYWGLSQSIRGIPIINQPVQRDENINGGKQERQTLQVFSAPFWAVSSSILGILNKLSCLHCEVIVYYTWIWGLSH